MERGRTNNYQNFAPCNQLCLSPHNFCLKLSQQLHIYKPGLAENVLYLEVNFEGEKMTFKDLLKAIDASFNSGGGVLEIKISDYSDLKEGTFWTKLDRF